MNQPKPIPAQTPDTTASSSPATAPDSICLLKLSAIGDVCHTIPLVRRLQAGWPDTRLTWVINELEATLVGDMAGVEFIIINKAAGWRAVRTLVRQLKGRRFGVLLMLQYAFRASLLSTQIKADRRVGYDRARARDLQWLFSNQTIAPAPQQHVMEALLSFADAIDTPPAPLTWKLPTRPSPGALPANYMALSAAASDPVRDWLPARYAQVADHAFDQHGVVTVLTGGPALREKELANVIARQMQTHAPTNLVGQTSLPELAAVLADARLLLAPDSGPVHLATAVDTPVIGLYGTSNPQRTGPYLSLAHCVDLYAENLRRATGKSVSQVRWGHRVNQDWAMAAISVELVVERLDQLLATE